MSDKKTPKERRQHKRYSVKSCSFSAKSKFGEIVDISIGGLAFTYIDRGEWKKESLELGVLFGNDELCLSDIPFKIISDCAIGSGLSMIRRCGIQFEALTPAQISQLEYFIWINTKAVDRVEEHNA